MLEGSTLKSGRKGMLLIEGEKAKCYYLFIHAFFLMLYELPFVYTKLAPLMRQLSKDAKCVAET